jgi:hypothetical protein
MARRRLALRSVLGVALVLGMPVAGQSPYPQFPSTNSGRNGQLYPDSGSDAGPDSGNPEKKRIKLLNAERQRALISDTDKLLKLARELNQEVTANDSGAMTGQQLHKLDEIGKLAKSVKEKMSYTVGGFPNINGPLTIQPGIH